MAYDYRSAQLPEDDRALCDFAIKLTLAPAEMNNADVATLRQHGFSDDQITVATQVIGYFNYINRVAEGLGVNNESWMTISIDAWRDRKGHHYLATLRQDTSDG